MMREVAGQFDGTGVRVVDGAVLGNFRAGGRVPLLLTGEGSDSLAALLPPSHFAAEAIEGRVGDASAIKMLRSVLLKGLEALFVECLVAAEVQGLRTPLMTAFRDLDERPFTKTMEVQTVTHLVHAARRLKEVERVAQVLAADRRRRHHDRGDAPALRGDRGRRSGPGRWRAPQPRRHPGGPGGHLPPGRGGGIMSDRASWLEVPAVADLDAAERSAYDGLRRADGSLHNLYKPFAAWPTPLVAADRLYRDLMHPPEAPLAAWERELVATQVAILARCAYATAHHGANFRALLGDETRGQAMLDALEGEDLPSDLFDARLAAIVAYGRKLTLAPEEMTADDLAAPAVGRPQRGGDLPREPDLG